MSTSSLHNLQLHACDLESGRRRQTTRPRLRNNVNVRTIISILSVTTLALILTACVTELMHTNAQHLAILFHILSLIPNIDEPINFLQADEVPLYTRC